MKKTFLTIVLTLSTFICRGWEYELLSNLSVRPQKAVELENGDILISFTEKSFQADTQFSCHILRLGKNGEFKSRTNFTNHFLNFTMGGGGLALIDGFIIFPGLVANDSGSIKPCIIKMTQNLDIVFDTIYDDFSAMADIWRYSESEYIVSVYTGDINVNSYLSYWKLDNSFNVLNILTDSSAFLPFDFSWTTFDEKASDIYSFSINNRTLSKIETINLNKIKSYIAPFPVYYESRPFVSSRGNIILSGIKEDIISWPTKHHLHLISLDTSLNEIDSITYLDDTPSNRPAAYHSLAEFDSSLYFGGTNNYGVSSNPANGTEYSSFMLLKVDLDLNLIWAKKYKNDCSYVMTSVMNTNDGGILMIGERWNWPEDSLKKEVSLYVLKVDEDGNPTGVDEQKFNSPKLTIYPNPSSDFVRINLSSNGEYEVKTIKVVNTLGESVHQAEFKGSQYKLDSSKWPAGTYFISVTTEEGKETKRFVKM